MTKKTHEPEPSNKHISEESALKYNRYLRENSTPLEALKAIIFNSSDTNQAKIEFIKEDIANGRYQIESLSIANKLTEFSKTKAEPEMA